MSMHLRGSRDMMGHQEEEGWWKSRTGLEQKLLILSTLLFILSFGLTISVIVLKNKTCPTCPEITSTTEPSTGSTETSTGTSPDTPITGDASSSTGPTVSVSDTSPTVSVSETSPTVSVSATSPTVSESVSASETSPTVPSTTTKKE